MNWILPLADTPHSPSDIVAIAAAFLGVVGESNIAEVIIAQVTPDAASLDAPGRLSPPELAILDSLIPQSDSQLGKPVEQFDSHGRSVIARGFESLLAVLSLDRSLLSGGSHVPLCLRICYAALDESAVLGGSRGIYKQDIDLEYLTAVQIEADQLVSYWAVTAARNVSNSWHMTAAPALLKSGSTDPVLAVLQHIVRIESSLSPRMLRDTLIKILRATDPDVASLERWLGLAQTVSNDGAYTRLTAARPRTDSLRFQISKLLSPLYSLSRSSVSSLLDCTVYRMKSLVN